MNSSNRLFQPFKSKSPFVLEGAAGTGVAGKATAELGESPHPSAPCKLCIACWVIGSEPIQTFCICVPAPPDQHSTESEPFPEK